MLQQMNVVTRLSRAHDDVHDRFWYMCLTSAMQLALAFSVAHPLADTCSYLLPIMYINQMLHSAVCILTQTDRVQGVGVESCILVCGCRIQWSVLPGPLQTMSCKGRSWASRLIPGRTAWGRLATPLS